MNYLNTFNMKKIMVLALILAIVLAVVLMSVETASAHVFNCAICNPSGEVGRYWFR